MAEKRTNSSECCYSESCGSSCSSLSESETSFYPWFENVGPKGELFHIENGFSPEYCQDHLNPESDNLHRFKMEKPDLKLKTSEKLKKWMKKRKKKVRKSFNNLKSDESFNYDNSTVSLDPFLLHSFKEVFINVNTSRLNFGRRFSLSEELLGLELGTVKESNNSFMDGKIRVLGVVPGSDISSIKVGDWLRSVNDINVTINNLDDILRGLSLPSKVKLLVSSSFEKPFTGDSCHHCKDSLLELFCNNDTILKIKSEFCNVPHGIFYLVIEDDSLPNEGVLFKYPEEETPLFHLKGMFVTLSHMISDACSPPLLSCTTLVQGELVHIAFVKEGNDTFVLALPLTCSTVSEVQYLVTILVKLLKFQFSSLKEAFATEDYDNQLEKFVTLFFKHYLSNYFHKNKPSSHLLDILPSAHWLPLPSDFKMEIDDILSELESSDYGSMSDGFDRNQRIYSILGSCLFYKGYLLGNHLPKHHFLDIHSFLHFYHILSVTKGNLVPEIIVWKEVYPNYYQESSVLDSEFEETRGRYFMLIVSMHHCVLSILLEAGGCSIRAEGHPPPEPFYVEEVQNTLIILHDCGIINEIEKMFNHCLPPIASPYEFFKESSLVKSAISSILSNSMVPRSLNINMKHTGLHSNFSSSKLEKGPADGESDVDSSHSDISIDNLDQSLRSYSISAGSTTESQGSGDYSNSQANNSKRTTTSSSELSYFNSEIENNCNEKSFSLVTNYGNTLFQYLHMDPVEGVFLSPAHDILDIDDIVIKKIHQNFFHCCLKMRTAFAKSLRNEKIINSTVTKYGVNSFFRNMYEQGILFHYNHKDGTKFKHSLTFWVVGLIFGPEPRELYVCYHDSTEQDVVEIAFRLGFGLSL